MIWKHTLGIPGPPVATNLGNFPATILFLTVNSFFIQSGFAGEINAGDTVIITSSTIAGTYTAQPGSTPATIVVTPVIPFFSGNENVFIEIIRPVSVIQETEIEEPQGFADIVFNVQRDERWHGVFFEASTSTLGFYGLAFDMLLNQKNSYGVDAVVIYTADVMCDGETTFTEAISGKLNFSNYEQTCGLECFVRLSVEQDNCAMIFKNRFDQKVNIDYPFAFDKSTNLVPYTGLGFNMDLATQVIPISADADVSLDSDTVNITAVDLYFQHQNLLIRPIYGRVTDNSILTGALDDPINVFEIEAEAFLLTPQVLLEENPLCIVQEFTYSIRLKGTLVMNVNSTVGSNIIVPFTVVDYWDGIGVHYGPGNLTGNAIELHRDQIAPGILDGVTYPFDITYNGTVALPIENGLYAYIKFYSAAGISDSINADFTVTFDSETSFLLTNDKECPPTDAQVYLINETLARVTESITDRCLTIESDYYGRTDSEPYAATVDGCGSLRVLTPGLKIRQATDKDFFASMKELMEGLRAIDNIGMGMETDRVRIEPAEYFYQNTKILDIALVPANRIQIDETRVYSNIKTGYLKWEIKSIKGIDEFNSSKEFRTSLKAISNELNIQSELIASGYIIENLRTSTLVNTGQTDNTYDNDVFIIVVARDAYGSYIVEQGVAENAANFYSPATAYNWRIRPIYNLMRWFKSIAQSYVNLSNTMSKLFFTSGKGNYLAEGNLNAADPCRLESKVIAENEDIDISDFMDVADGTPIYKPETITFDYPLSIADYKLIKAAPYGYFNVQCGRGSFEKYFIKTLAYKPAAGTAEFTLITKWV